MGGSVVRVRCVRGGGGRREGGSVVRVGCVWGGGGRREGGSAIGTIAFVKDDGVAR